MPGLLLPAPRSSSPLAASPAEDRAAADQTLSPFVLTARRLLIGVVAQNEDLPTVWMTAYPAITGVDEAFLPPITQPCQTGRLPNARFRPGDGLA